MVLRLADSLRLGSERSPAFLHHKDAKAPRTATCHATDTGDEITNARVRTAQIVAAALLNGVLIFAGIAVFLVQQRGKGLSPPTGMPVISYAAVALFVLDK